MRLTSVPVAVAMISGVFWGGSGPARAEMAVETIREARSLEARVKGVTARAMPATVSLFSEKNGASGSGVIISPEGLVLTAGHVVEGLDEVTVVFPDGKQARAEVLGANYTKDSAMVKLKGAGPWPWVETGDSKKMQVGDFVVALGHAGGYDPVRTPPVRFGRVVGRNRLGYIVTDCTLIGGDSGGPLFNLEGQVVGIHSSIGPELVVNNHRGVNDFRRDWDRLLKGDTWGQLTNNPLRDPDRPVIGFHVEGEARGGILVGDVEPGSPASAAGMQRGDVLQAIDGRPVRNFRGLLTALSKREPGQKVKVEFLRDGRMVERRLKLARLGDVYGE